MKTVCPQGRVGSNPTLSASLNNQFASQTGYFIFVTVQYLCSYLFSNDAELIRAEHGEVPKLAEGTPLERVQVVNSGAGVQIPPSPFVILQLDQIEKVFEENCKNLLTNAKPHDIIYELS